MTQKKNDRVLWTALSLASCLVLGQLAIAEDSQTSTYQPQVSEAAGESADTMQSPKQVCSSLVEAAKKEDFKTIKLLTMRPNLLKKHTQMAGRAAGSKKASDRYKIPPQAMPMIKDLTCGTEHVAADHAVVEAETKGQKRLIPFIQKNGQWKFDVRTYQSFYGEGMKSMKAKS